MRFYVTRLGKALSLLKAACAGMMKDDTLGMGAALAFYTVFSLGPLLILATAVAARVVGGDEVRADLSMWMAKYLSPEGARFAEDVVGGSRQFLTGLTETLIGIATLFFGATGVFRRLKISLNTILGGEPKARPVVHRLLLGRLEALAAACLVGLVISLALLLSAAVAAVGSFVGQWVPLPVGLLFVTNLALSLVIVTPLFALIFKWLPDTRVPWKSVILGSAVTAVLFQAGALAIGAYLGARVLASVYGPAGSVLAVLIWAYYSAQTVLFGAEFTKAHAAAGRRSEDEELEEKRRGR